jgi:hypothetical protein
MNRLKRCAMPAVLAAAAATLCSCGAIIGLALDKTRHTRKVDALYHPPPERILVFVDEGAADTEQPVKRLLSERLSQLFEENRIGRGTVPYERVLDLGAVTPRFNELSPAEIGRALHAGVVCHVRIDEFSLRSEEVENLWEGRLLTTVWMIDAETGKRLWPKGSPDGFHVPEVTTPMATSASADYGMELARSLAFQAATEIARLFHDHRLPISNVEWER